MKFKPTVAKSLGSLVLGLIITLIIFYIKAFFGKTGSYVSPTFQIILLSFVIISILFYFIYSLFQKK